MMNADCFAFMSSLGWDGVEADVHVQYQMDTDINVLIKSEGNGATVRGQSQVQPKAFCVIHDAA